MGAGNQSRVSWELLFTAKPSLLPKPSKILSSTINNSACLTSPLSLVPSLLKVISLISEWHLSPSGCYALFPGGVGVKCPLTEQGKQLAIQVSNILGMDFCGIDLLIMDDGSFMVCEANANVGFLAFDQACNLDVGAIIADYAMSLLPNRQTGKMPSLPGLASPREKNEPNVSAQGVAESAYATTNGSTSSESEPELAEVRDSSAKAMGAPPAHVARAWLQH